MRNHDNLTLRPRGRGCLGLFVATVMSWIGQLSTVLSATSIGEVERRWWWMPRGAGWMAWGGLWPRAGGLLEVDDNYGRQ